MSGGEEVRSQESEVSGWERLSARQPLSFSAPPGSGPARPPITIYLPGGSRPKLLTPDFFPLTPVNPPHRFADDIGNSRIQMP